MYRRRFMSNWMTSLVWLLFLIMCSNWLVFPMCSKSTTVGDITESLLLRRFKTRFNSDCCGYIWPPVYLGLCNATSSSGITQLSFVVKMLRFWCLRNLALNATRSLTAYWYFFYKFDRSFSKNDGGTGIVPLKVGASSCLSFDPSPRLSNWFFFILFSLSVEISVRLWN